MKPSGPPSLSIRSPSFFPRLSILTDSRIAHYCRLGFYGPTRQRDQLLTDATARAKRREPRPVTATAAALSLLGL